LSAGSFAGVQIVQTTSEGKPDPLHEHLRYWYAR
jgi:hypothetical protein